MTTQTKKFIELSDILALRFECKKCGSELLISSLRDISNRDEQGKLSTIQCAVIRGQCCGSTCELAIAEFLSSLNKLRGLIGSQGSFPAGFSMTAEIKADARNVTALTYWARGRLYGQDGIIRQSPAESSVD